jgi:hypothetical protein
MSLIVWHKERGALVGLSPDAAGLFILIGIVLIFQSVHWQMNFVKIGSFMINLDNVTHWVEIAKAEFAKQPSNDQPPAKPLYTPSYGPSDEPVVLIYHLGQASPITLSPDLSRAFVGYIRANHSYGEAKLEKPDGTAAGC